MFKSNEIVKKQTALKVLNSYLCQTFKISILKPSFYSVNSHPRTITLNGICFILQGDRKVSLLAGIAFAFILHVICIYWWYRNDDILYPLAMLPPNPTPFWHAIFTILVNGMDLFM